MAVERRLATLARVEQNVRKIVKEREIFRGSTCLSLAEFVDKIVPGSVRISEGSVGGTHMAPYEIPSLIITGPIHFDETGKFGSQGSFRIGVTNHGEYPEVVGEATTVGGRVTNGEVKVSWQIGLNDRFLEPLSRSSVMRVAGIIAKRDLLDLGSEPTAYKQVFDMARSLAAES